MAAVTSLAILALGASPLALALMLLIGRRLPGWRAGVAAWCLAFLVAAAPGPYHLAPAELLAASLRGLLLAVVVAYVLFAGLLLYDIVERAGAIRAIAGAIAGTSHDPARQALLVAGGLSPFFESVSGFGLAVVVVGPLLVALGFPQRRATLLALLGQNAVPWGAMAIGTLVGAELSGLSASRMGVGSAWLNLPLAFFYNTVAVAVAAGPRAVPKRLPDILTGAAALGGGVLLVSATSVELAGIAGGVAATAMQLALAHLAERRLPAASATPSATPLAHPCAVAAGPSPRPGVPSLARSVIPYAVLLAGLLASRLVGPLHAWLDHNLVLAAPSYGFRLPLLYSPAFFLLVASVAGYAVFRPSATETGRVLGATCRQWWPAACAAGAFIALSAVMYTAGMTPRLAATAGALAGVAFAPISPLVGGLGGLMTGSNTGGNAMFVQFQVETARRAALPPDVFAYANNVAAANATMASPSRVVLAASVTGERNQEGMILRAILPAVAGALVLIAVHVTLWTGLR